MSTEGLPATAYRKPRRTYFVARRALRAPTSHHRDDALASYEPTMLERVRGAIAEATADHLIAATGPGPLLADYGGRNNLGTPKAL